MIHIVTAENRRLFHHALMEMHIQRKTVFVDEMKWPLDVSSGVEVDAYDCPEAVYLIEAASPRGPVTGSARLLPTTRPHLLGEVFSNLCAEPAPEGPDVWEATRFCPAPSTPRGKPRQAMLQRMIAAIMETAILFGVSRVTFVAGAGLAPLARNAGWSVKALGPAKGEGRERLVAMAAVIDSEGLARVRLRAGASGPLTRFMPGLAHAA